MCRARYYVDDIWKISDDLRKCVDDVLNAFIRGKKAKCENRPLSRQATLLFVGVRVNKWKIWNSMRNYINPFFRNIIDVSRK